MDPGGRFLGIWDRNRKFQTETDILVVISPGFVFINVSKIGCPFWELEKSEMDVLGRLSNDFGRKIVQKAGYRPGISDFGPDFKKNSKTKSKIPKITLEPRKLLHCYS